MSAPSFDISRAPVDSFTRLPADVRAGMPAATAVGMLMRATPRKLFVTADDSKRLVGVITPCDLEKMARTPPPKTAKDLATTTKLIAVRAGATIADALDIMAGRNDIKKTFDSLPVVSGDNELVGMVLRADLESQLLAAQRQASSSRNLSY